MIELQNLAVILNDKVILRALNFSWHKGETVALVGANGAGKTTLLKVLSTLIKPTSGKLKLADGVTSQQWRRLFGAVFQESFLYDELSAQENLLFYQQLYGDADRRKTEYLLQLVNLLNVKDERTTAFSKGMKQRLSIARALIHEPMCLLLDEPFEGLDLASKKTIEAVLHERKRAGAGWILVSHDIDDAWRLCDRVVFLHDGTVLLEKPCHEQQFASFLTYYKKVLERG